MFEHIDIDKSEWSFGPWMDEPDRLQWSQQEFVFIILRSAYGHLCGYIRVPKGHPWDGVNYNHISGVHVHGGLTFSERDSNGYWWVGFDCAHAGDYSPGMTWETVKPDRYKSITYVKAELDKLLFATIRQEKEE